MSLEILENQLKAWNNKPALRALYEQWFNVTELMIRRVNGNEKKNIKIHTV
jgi:hypothetical protein